MKSGDSNRGTRATLVLLYGVTIFTGAFLLFQIQPIIAKIILPWFGGSSAVWTTCLLFFQTVLLLGYVYAHWLNGRLAPKAQIALHIGLLAASLLVLHANPGAGWKPSGDEDPAFRILGLLTASIGLPYFLLSSTSPLLQAWYARSRRSAFPYRFYALSNLACLLALLTYPVVFEPLLETQRQAQGWSIGYVAFALLCGAVAISSVRGRPEGDGMTGRVDGGATAESGPPAWTSRILWLVLTACSSALLLAVTNHLCQNVASIPFLWILPLSLYLLSFILCFDSERWYRRAFWLTLLAVLLAAMSYVLLTELPGTNLKVQIPLFAVGLFVCCMFCHGELAARKPHASHLTAFYLMVSAGGALGAALVGLAAPAVFDGYFELPLGIAACAALALLIVYGRSKAAELAWVLLAVALVFSALLQIRSQQAGARLAVRNFYGGLKVVDEGDQNQEDRVRVLYHGGIIHGSQFLSGPRRREPTTYYGPASGVGLAIENWRYSSQYVGVIGLGAGTVASYGRAGDRYRFYEINPLVIDVANREFSFLKDSAATTEVVLGDARLALEQEPPQNFDLLAVDAFSGDSIPIHLLSQEAFQLYLRHLKPGGMVAVHVSNRSLELRPVVQKVAESLGKDAWSVESRGEERKHIFRSTWVLLADQGLMPGKPALRAALTKLETARGVRLWTDDYSNLFQALK